MALSDWEWIVIAGLGPTRQQRELIDEVIEQRERDAARRAWERAEEQWMQSLASMAPGQTYRIPTIPEEYK